MKKPSKKRVEYTEFILSPEWAAIRLQAFKIHGRICNHCSGTDHLRIHHKTYERFGGKEDPANDLMVLCEDCHNEHHGRKANPARINTRADQLRRARKAANGVREPEKRSKRARKIMARDRGLTTDEKRALRNARTREPVKKKVGAQPFKQDMTIRRRPKASILVA